MMPQHIISHSGTGSPPTQTHIQAHPTLRPRARQAKLKRACERGPAEWEITQLSGTLIDACHVPICWKESRANRPVSQSASALSQHSVSFIGPAHDRKHFALISRRREH